MRVRVETVSKETGLGLRYVFKFEGKLHVRVSILA